MAYNSFVPWLHRGRRLLGRLDRWMGEILAAAIEADLRDAGYQVLGRTEGGAVVWAEPATESSVSRSV